MIVKAVGNADGSNNEKKLDWKVQVYTFLLNNLQHPFFYLTDVLH